MSSYSLSRVVFNHFAGIRTNPPKESKSLLESCNKIHESLASLVDQKGRLLIINYLYCEAIERVFVNRPLMKYIFQYLDAIDLMRAKFTNIAFLHLSESRAVARNRELIVQSLASTVFVDRVGLHPIEIDWNCPTRKKEGYMIAYQIKGQKDKNFTFFDHHSCETSTVEMYQKIYVNYHSFHPLTNSAFYADGNWRLTYSRFK